MPLQTMPLVGTFYFYGKAKSHIASLVKTGNRLSITLGTDQATLVYDIQNAVISEALANLPGRVVFNTGDVFQCTESGPFATIFEPHRSKFSNAIHKLESSNKLALFALFLVPLIAYGVLTWLLPIATIRVAAAVPSSLIKQLDQQVLASMDGYVFAATKASEIQKEKLQQAWNTLPHGYGYTLLGKDGGIMGANAMALPGGSIIVTDALLELLTTQELIAVLAHEMGHVELQHGLRNIIQSLGVTMVFSTIIGDVSLLAESALVAAPVVIQQMSYSRDMEREADVFAHRKLAEIGISPACLGSALQRLIAAHKQNDSVEHSWQDFLSTHPSIGERIKSVEGTRCSQGH